MENNYFLQTLYPFQDKVLRIIEQLPVNFYLTGSTALSRGFLQHRYSTDLNFWINSPSDFKYQIRSIIDELKNKQFNIDLNVETQFLTELFIKENDVFLKIEFVNDIKFRVGLPDFNTIFKSLDNIDNILINKILILENLELEDIIDVLYICFKYNFSWAEVFKNVEQKNLWIDNKFLSDSLKQIKIDKLDHINWIQIPLDISKFQYYLNILSADISELNNNMLFQNN